MCPGMPHVKFQSPGINIDRYFQLSAGIRKGGRKEERKKVKGPRCRAWNLPQGKSGVKIGVCFPGFYYPSHRLVSNSNLSLCNQFMCNVF